MARQAGRTLSSLHPDQVALQHKEKKNDERNVCFFLENLLFSVIHDYFIDTIFQRSEIICHLADLLTERKEEILAANKADMDRAVNEGRITRRKSNVLFDFTIREKKDQTLIAKREEKHRIVFFFCSETTLILKEMKTERDQILPEGKSERIGEGGWKYIYFFKFILRGCSLDS